MKSVAENPERRRVPRKPGDRQQCPAAEKVHENGNTNGISPEQDKRQWYPREKCQQRGENPFGPSFSKPTIREWLMDIRTAAEWLNPVKACGMATYLLASVASG